MPEETNFHFSRFYEALRRIARQLLRNERNGITQQPTDLVHDAYRRLHGPFDGDSHFLRNARTQMEWLLLDYARRKQRKKRGGKNASRKALHDGVAAEEPYEPPDREGIERAIAEVDNQSERAGRVIRKKFFEGLTHEEIAKELGITDRTVDRDWKFARAILFKELEKVYG